MQFYTIDTKYLDYLRTFDTKVPKDDKGNSRPFIGVLFEINNIKFLAPLTSYKNIQDNLKNSCPTIFKLYCTKNVRKLGMIQLRFMIPVVDSAITPLIINNINDYKYKNLLNLQYFFIKREAENISQRATKLYNLVVHRQNSFFKSKSCDFSTLINASNNFLKTK